MNFEKITRKWWVISFRLPFDWKDPIGYSLAVLIEFRITSIPIRLIECFFALGLTAFLFSKSLANDINDRLRSMIENVQNGMSRNKIRKKFIENIRSSNKKRYGIFSETFKKNDKFSNINWSLFSDCLHLLRTFMNLYLHSYLWDALEQCALQC